MISNKEKLKQEIINNADKIASWLLRHKSLFLMTSKDGLKINKLIQVK